MLLSAQSNYHPDDHPKYHPDDQEYNHKMCVSRVMATCARELYEMSNHQDDGRKGT